VREAVPNNIFFSFFSFSLVVPRPASFPPVVVRIRDFRSEVHKPHSFSSHPIYGLANFLLVIIVKLALSFNLTAKSIEEPCRAKLLRRTFLVIGNLRSPLPFWNYDLLIVRISFCGSKKFCSKSGIVSMFCLSQACPEECRNLRYEKLDVLEF
jgi:hypothetical protein